MKLEEHLLHYIWPLIKAQEITLNTTTGNPIEIIEPGKLNRSEEKLFETKDPTMKWDGTYQGERVMQGSYMYMVNLIYQNETRYKTEGQVLLLE